MILLARLSNSALALLLCMAVGALVGIYAPVVGAWGHVVGQLYLAVVSMASVPLLVVATFFGLRLLMSLPAAGRRMLMIAGCALLLVLACAAVGVLSGWLTSPASHINAEARAQLGAMVMQGASDEGIGLYEDRGAPVVAQAARTWAVMFPDNFFRALADGQSLGILTCAVLFGLAFSVFSRERGQALSQLFEAIYRALEIIIDSANRFLPLIAFGMSAHLFSQADPASLRAMGGFISQFLLLVVVLGALALAFVQRRSGLPMMDVLRHLKAPVLVSLVSASSTASIPHTIEAMSTRLGFSRGVVELIVPLAAVYLRAGSALYYALLTMFVAHLYGRSMDVADLALIGMGACAAAFASAGTNSMANLGFAVMVLAVLQLPPEAAMALFAAIDSLCEGPRNVLALLACCVLIAVVSAGLPSERTALAQPELLPAPAAPLRLVLTRTQAMLLAGGAALTAALIVLLGVGIGLRQADVTAVQGRGGTTASGDSSS